MINKQKLIDKLENLVYDSEDKMFADKLITNYIKLINYVNLDDYKARIKLPISLEIKHKAYSKTVNLVYKSNQLYLDNKLIELVDINKILPNLFEPKIEE